jgi:hypothetical protein
MKLTERKIAILWHLRRYPYLRAAQLGARLIPQDDDGSIIRSELRKLEQAGYARRYVPRMVDPLTGGAPPVWVITVKGAAVLAQVKNDCALLVLGEYSFADWMSVNHRCALSGLAMTLHDAFAASSVTFHTLVFEYEVVRDSQDPAQRYKLYTRVSDEPKVLACPDMLLETEMAGWRRAWYVEYETGSDGSPGRVAARKHKGFAGLAEKKLWKKHAPQARDMRVLCFVPCDSWRKELLAELKGKPGAGLWLVCSTPEVTAATFLHEPIFWKLDESGVRGPLPLIPQTAPASKPGVEQAGEHRTEEAAHVQVRQS